MSLTKIVFGLFLSFVVLAYSPGMVFATAVSVTGKAKVLNTNNSYLDFTSYNSNATVDNVTGNFSGYAFLEDVGWVAFGTTDNSLGPVNVNLTSGAVTGKAKSLNTGAYVDFTNYSSNVTANIITGVFSGYVFSEDVGWLNFADTGVSAPPTLDAVGPTVELDSPGDNSYTNNERPTFKWKEATDAISTITDYDLIIDNPSLGSGQPSGDFTISDIPLSRTSDYETSKYIVHYEGFSDSDSSNNYISVYTRSSSEWSSDSNSGENDGKLREGIVRWTVKAVDSVGNETSTSRTLFVDRTNPRVELTQINDTPFTTSSYSTTDKTPTIYGKITDPLAGGDSSQTQDENGPRVASGPKQVEFKLEKKEGLLYKLHTIYTLNFDKGWYTCGNTEVTDNTKQKCDKYLPFEYIQKEALPFGTYRITVTGKDKADNGAETHLILNITTLSQIITPEEKEIIEEEIKDLPQEEQEQIREDLEITKPIEPSASVNFFDSLIAFVRNLFNSIGQGIQIAFNWVGNRMQLALNTVGRTIASVFNSIGNVYNSLAQNSPGIIKSSMLAIGNTFSDMMHGVNNAIAATKSGIANLAFAIGIKVEDVSYIAGTAFIKFGYLFVPEATTISNVKVAASTATSMTITWETNHPASGKVNYGLTPDYGQDAQSDKRTNDHEFTITGLTPNTTYHYEVMSQNRNYVYDANHTFTTSAK